MRAKRENVAKLVSFENNFFELLPSFAADVKSTVLCDFKVRELATEQNQDKLEQLQFPTLTFRDARCLLFRLLLSTNGAGVSRCSCSVKFIHIS